MFYISLLELYKRRIDEKPPKSISLNKNNRYQVESIRKKYILKKQDSISD